MKKILLKIILVIFAFALINIVFGYFYEKPIRKAKKNNQHSVGKKWNKIYNNKNKYEIIFLGSSRGDFSYNARIVDSLSSYNAINMCTGSQNIIETYYVLEQLLQTQHPLKIYYELFPPSFISEKFDYYKIISNVSFIHDSRIKRTMTINGFGFKGILSYLSPFYRNKSYIQSSISNIIKRNKKINLKIQGKRNWTKKFTIKEYQASPLFDIETIKDEEMKYLIKINDLCKENNIEFITTMAPYSPSLIKYNIKKFYKQKHFFENYMNQYNIPFIDMTCNEISLTDSNYIDGYHLNIEGKAKFTIYFVNSFIK